MNKRLAGGRFQVLLAPLIAGLLSLPAQASNETLMQLLRILHEKGSLTSEEYEMLVSAGSSEADQEAQALAEVKKEIDNLPEFTVGEGKYVIESSDGDNSFQPIGRIMWDQLSTSEDSAVSVFDGGAELRRARLGMQGKASGNWKYKLVYDFAGSDAVLKDGWIAYGNRFGGNGRYEVKVGQHHVPFGFTTISSSKYMTFIRRPLFADGPLSPARQAGVAAKFHDTDFRWMLAAGYFHDEPEDGAVGAPGENAKTRALRLTGIPYAGGDDRFLHVGASVMKIDQADNNFRVRQRAITHLDPARMFDTGTIAGGVDDVKAFDLEALLIFDSFYAMGELVSWSVSGTGGTSDFDLGAWSLEAGYFLTGESKGYKSGQFDSVKPGNPFPGGAGAWEVGVRWENMDLTDGAILGGDGDVLTAGINWYPVKNIRVMLDYNRLVNFDRPGHPDDGTSPSSISLRTQVYW